MRRLLVIALAALACQRSGLQTAEPDAGETVADTSVSPPDSRVGPERPSVPDVPACVPLLPTPLADLDPRLCPPSPAPAACGGGDTGAIVARGDACTRAWGDILFQCIVWPAIPPGQEMVVLEASNCLDTIEIQSARACDDHIEVSYAEYVACEACGSQQSALRAFLLPLDPRPVIATRRSIPTPCPPPPSSGGTTGSGGATGAGGTTGSGGSPATCAIGGGDDCAKGPINQRVAGLLYIRDVLGGQSSWVPGQGVGAAEKCVPGLWDALQAQLFGGQAFAVDGTIVSECCFLLRGCTVTMVMPEDECATFGPILSGVVAEGAFYYSYRVGSGIAYSVLGKLAWEGAELVRTQSPYYKNPSDGPPHLVVAKQGGQVVVYRAMVDWRKFNEWHEPAELIGMLADFGDHLGIVDSSGQELGSTLP